MGCCAKGGARLADEVRGAAKPRGRGLGQRNIKNEDYICLQIIFECVVMNCYL